MKIDSIAKQIVIYTSACIDGARLKREESFKSGTSLRSPIGWNDDDVNFDAGLEKWDVGLVDLKSEQTVPKRIFRCWIEDW